MISKRMKRVYSEVDAFLNSILEENREKVPPKIRELIAKEKDKEYFPQIDMNKPILEQNLMQETIDIIALLNLKCWCDDEEEKQRLIAIYKMNDEKQRKKYDNIFNS